MNRFSVKRTLFISILLLFISFQSNAQEVENDSVIVGVERSTVETTVERTVSTKKSSTKKSSSNSSSSSINVVKVSGDSVDRKFIHNEIIDEFGPRIELITPIVSRGVKILEVNKLVTVMGKVEDDHKIKSVIINSIPAKVTSDGEFWATIPLDYGENEISIEATDALHNGSFKKFVIDRKMTIDAPPVSTNQANRITWQSPRKMGEKTADSLFLVQVCVESSDSIETVKLWLNGWKALTVRATELESLGNCKYSISKQVSLKLDANRIRIEVVTNKTRFDDEIELFYNTIEPQYYALLIGNEDYKDPEFGKLGEPVSDAYKLKNVLETQYNFNDDKVIILKNASRADILNAFAEFRQKITENDNVLIFFAGHGRWVEDMKMGFWIPIDAEGDNESNWLSNSDITTQIRALKSKHTLLISDACFSGSIFATRGGFNDDAGVAVLYDLPSRNAMTSGNKTEVPDVSVFMEYLVKRLEQNTNKYLTAGELYMSLRIAVTGNSPAVPIFGPLQDTGDEGGDFIFVKNR
jgi:hypothetical protein